MAITVSQFYLKGTPNTQSQQVGLGTFTPKGSWTRIADHFASTADKWRHHDGPRSNGAVGNAAVAPYRSLIMTFVTDPLDAVASYAATLDLVLGVVESDTRGDLAWRAHVWVTQGDTDVVRT